jgi:phenylacetate-coenzyme A ligase PaaK-like adenylate-forming protein
MRFARALVRSRLAGRRYLLPKDLWAVKCLATGGTDTALFRSQIEEDWGKTPIEAYGATELLGLLSIQSWNAKGLTFFPDANFIEFLPEEQSDRCREDPDYRPHTILLDQVKAGERYELVITNLMGGILVRYLMGDLIEITSLEDEEVGIALPQMVFHSRVDDIVDLAGFTRLTERDIWQAIEQAGVDYVDWTARKEYSGQKPVLHLFIELDPVKDEEEVRHAILSKLRKIHKPLSDLESMLGIDPLKLTLLPAGSFAQYSQARQREGADLAHLKPPHMNASDKVIEMLLSSPS